MKYTLYICSLSLLFACEQKPSKYLVHAVHNTCTGKWAVQTGDSFYLGVKSRIDEINSGGLTGWYTMTDEEEKIKDTVSNAKLGDELQFPSIDSAMIAYLHWRGNPDTVLKYRAIAAAKREREKKIADSVFKCNHTYK